MTRPSFGYCLPIFANPSAGLFRTPNYDRVDAQEVIRLGKHAEDLGFDSLWMADHLMLGREEAVLEGWTTVSALAGATSRAKLGVIHQSNYFRNPSLTAKMTATLDQISGGRFILFYDFGRQEREHRAYGLPYPSDVDIRTDETIAGLELIKALWSSDGPVTATVGPYAVTNAVCNPGPMQTPHPPIWFGELEDGLLRACARFGQGWNTTPCSLTELDRRLGLLRAACDAENRPLAEIEVSVEIQVLLTDSGDIRPQLQQLLAKAPVPAEVSPDLIAYANGSRESPLSSFSDITVYGDAAQVATQLKAYVDRGADHFLLWFLDAPDRNGMDYFMREVAPKFS